MATIQNNPKARAETWAVQETIKPGGESSCCSVGGGVTGNIKLIGATLNTKGNVRIEEGTEQECEHTTTLLILITQSTPTTYGTVNIFMVGSVADLFLANVTISRARARP